MTRDELLQEVERLRNENASLRRKLETQGRFHLLFQNSPISLLETDFSQVKRRLDLLRAQGVKDLGVHFQEHPEELEACRSAVRLLAINQATLELLEARSLGEIVANARTILASWTNEDIITQFRRMLDGAQFQVEGSIHPLSGGCRHVICHLHVPVEFRRDWGKVLVSMWDITREKEVERELKRVSSQFQAVLDNASAGILMKDSEGRYLLVNRFVEEYMGLPADRLLGRTDFDLFPDPRARAMFAMDREVLGRRRTFTYEMAPRTSSGMRTLLVTKFPLLDEAGQASAICMFVTDITLRKQAEEDLHRANMELQGVMDYSPSAIFVLDLDDRMVLANKRLLEVLGMREQDVLGKTTRELHASEYAQSMEENTCYVLEHARPVTREISLSSEGRVRIFEETKFPLLDEDAHLRAVGGIATEITEKKQLMAEAVRAAQLASIGELAAAVAHEINNPITGIINYAQILKDLGGTTGLATQIPDKIIREGQRVAAIVHNLLSYARDRKSEAEPVDVAEVLDDALDLSRRQLEKEGIVLQVDKRGNLPLILARGHELQQVLLNLLSNARHALNLKYPEGCTDKCLQIALRRVDQPMGPAVEIRITDHGQGIPNGIRKRIMEPFFSTKAEGQGTGLGLPISDKIVREHHGTLRIDSVEGAWTRVTVLLPADSRKP